MGFDRYVWDRARRAFLGRFEAMYRAEDEEGFDSWRERDLRPLRKRISLAILDSYNFDRVLDVGCGKGTITHLLKRRNNHVVGIDMSETAIARARASYPDIEFRCADAMELATWEDEFDLVVVMGTLLYIERWERLVEALAAMTRWLYVTELVPEEPIGYVRSMTHLLDVVERHFRVDTKVVVDDVHLMLLATSRTQAGSGGQ